MAPVAQRQRRRMPERIVPDLRVLRRDRVETPGKGQHVRARRNHRLDIRRHPVSPAEADLEARLLNRQPLHDLRLAPVSRKEQPQFARRLGLRERPLLRAAPIAVADLAHALLVLRPLRRDRALAVIGVHLPPLVQNAPANLADGRRARIPAQVKPAIPHVALAETEDDPIAFAVNAAREIAIADQQPLFGTVRHRLRLQHMRRGECRQRNAGQENAHLSNLHLNFSLVFSVF